jgi:hypothetical protein
MIFHRRFLVTLLSIAALHGAGPLVGESAGRISTIVGRLSSGFSGDGGAGRLARIGYDGFCGYDRDGNLFIADNSNYRIRRVDAWTGIIATICGDGIVESSGDGGPALLARVSRIGAMVLDESGNLYFSEWQTHRIRRIDSLTGFISTIAGTGVAGYSGDGGPAAASRLNQPGSLAIDSGGNLFVADKGNQAVRRVDRVSGKITTFAGGNGVGYSGNGSEARNATLGHVVDMAFDSNDDLFLIERVSQVSTSLSHSLFIRRIDRETNLISVFSSTFEAQYRGDGRLVDDSNILPNWISFDSLDNLYLSEYGRIRIVDPVSRRVRTVAGLRQSGESGRDGGLAVQTQIGSPGKVAFDGSGKFVFQEGFRIRAVEGGPVAVRYQPDLSVARKGSDLIGEGRVNSSGSGQIAYALAGPPHSGLFRSRLRSSSTTTDRISLELLGKNRRFLSMISPLIFDSHVDIESPLRISVVLDPSETFDFWISWKSRPIRSVRKASFRVVARSESSPTKVDVVKVVVGDFDIRDPRLGVRRR